MTINKIEAVYERTNSIRATAEELKISESKVKKHLITAGKYESATSMRIRELQDAGYDESEIMERLNIGKSCYNANVRYTKAEYKSDHPSENAIRIRKHRERRGENE